MNSADDDSQIDPLVFQVKPRILNLLGDQLIRDATLAVFELVKNAYDADATECSVTMSQLTSVEKAEIVIRDNGSGMDEEIIRDSWMVIGTDHRAKQRAEGLRTPKHNRFPLGEKGLGRLSVHKLGRAIQLVSRKEGGAELVLEFDWDEIEHSASLDIATIKLYAREPDSFPRDEHGTEIKVTRLREVWARGDLRKLQRAVSGLCSPFESPSEFSVTLNAPGHEQWLEGLLDPNEVRESALYRVSGKFEGRKAAFDYTFMPPPTLYQRLDERVKEDIQCDLQVRVGRKAKTLDLSQHGIGEVGFDFWLFDRDPKAIRLVTDDVQGLKSYLDDNGGVRVYRDGIRVYDFGEPGNDWLNLDARRVNEPTAKTSNNQILGALRLDATQSGDLREKSNREGFIECPAYRDFISAVLSVLTSVEAERMKDRRRLREVTGEKKSNSVFTKLTELREKLKSRGILDEVEADLKNVEKEMETYRDQLLHAAVPGLTLGMMLHGAEKILEELREAARGELEVARIKKLVDQLYRAMRPVTNLLKNPRKTRTTPRKLIEEALFSTQLRLQRHKVTLTRGGSNQALDAAVEGSKQMLVASLTNIIDNAIHWLDIKGGGEKFLYVGATLELDGGPSIIVADNGPGFGDDLPEDLIEPFFTRRVGGMGLGLYIVNEVMRVHQGLLSFPARFDVDIPNHFSGAVVALQFSEVGK